MKNFAFVHQIKTLRTIFLIGLLLVLLWFYRVPALVALRFLDQPHVIVDYLKDFGRPGLVILFLLLVGQVFLAVIPGHALMMAGGYIYGAPLTITVVAISTTLGSQLAFWLARTSGRPLIYRLASPAVIERWDRIAGNHGALFFFFAFVLPIFPSDLMCYVAGLSKVSPRGFFIANVVGRTICAITITMIGVYGLRPPLGFWLLVAGSLTALTVAWKIYSKRAVRLPTKSEFGYAGALWMVCRALSEGRRILVTGNLEGSFRRALGVPGSQEGMIPSNKIRPMSMSGRATFWTVSHASPSKQTEQD